jgi:hypothetical protein
MLCLDMASIRRVGRKKKERKRPRKRNKKKIKERHVERVPLFLVPA